MMNINHFLSVYERLVKQEASSEEIDSLHMDLIPRVQNTHIAKAVCDVSSQLEKAIAIDNCAYILLPIMQTLKRNLTNFPEWKQSMK